MGPGHIPQNNLTINNHYLLVIVNITIFLSIFVFYNMTNNAILSFIFLNMYVIIIYSILFLLYCYV